MYRKRCKETTYDLSEVSLLIEDECHRCLKNYAYTFVAKSYKEQAKNQQILGMTASPGTDQETIKKIALNLGIETIELRTRESEDVKEYLQELEFETIKLDYPLEFKEISNLIRGLYDRKIEELKSRKLLFRPANKIALLELQGNLMGQISRGSKNVQLFSGVTACAQALKLSHLIELLETQTLHTAKNYIQTIFEQAKENKSRAVKQIVQRPEFNQAYIKLNEEITKKKEHPKLLVLKELIESSIKQIQKTKL
jgi:Fanconi anemia group M protein